MLLRYLHKDGQIAQMQKGYLQNLNSILLKIIKG